MQKIAGNPSDLTRLQRAAVAAIVTTKTNAEAAAVAGCSERSIYTWLQDPKFRAVLIARENQIRDATGRRLAVDADTALDVMHEIMTSTDNPDDLRLRASRAWLDFWIKTRDQSDLEARVTALEVRAKT